MDMEIEGIAANSIEAWMLQHNIHLSRDAINKLEQNGFILIDDLKYCSIEEMYNDAKNDMNIKLADCKKIKHAMQILEEPEPVTLMGFIDTENDNIQQIENQPLTLMGFIDNYEGIEFMQLNDSYEYKYQPNKYLEYQQNLILQRWQQLILLIPSGIQQLILKFSQYATYWSTFSLLYTDMSVQSNNCMKTFRGKQCFPINKGIYSFTVMFENVNDDTTAKGHILKGLNFVGICSEKFVEFNQYILYSDKEHIYGFGDDNESRAWITWLFSGKGRADEPEPWDEISRENGTFGHKDTVSIVVNMNAGYIKGYRNGYSFVKRQGGHIYLDFDPKIKYYPVVSMFTAQTQCTLSFGQ
eukprot:148681_1